jgi:sigma-E factor negative regulatory protein RseA
MPENAKQIDASCHREVLSALVDGRADSADEACALWRSEADARAAWHVYHLIGDAMRAPDLAVDGAREAALVRAVRERLAREPVVVAPAPGVRRFAVRRWTSAAAIAAGCAAVAGVVVVSRVAQAPGETGPVIAEAAPAPRGTAPAGVVPAAVAQAPRTVAAASEPLGDPQWQVVDGKLIRDARLDAYLRAHRAGVPALPGGTTGRFETVTLER